MAPGRRQGDRLRRAPDDVHRRLAGGPDPEGDRRRCSRCGWRRPGCTRSTAPRCATATRPSMFLGGESNHGKSMGQIEACRRGGLLVSTETTVIDEDGRRRSWARSRCSSRSAPRARSGPTRPRPKRGVEKFFGDMPTWELFEDAAPVDVVIVPAIDGNFDPSTNEMIPFERQFQTLHSLQNYFLLNELLAPGIADADRRHRGAARGRGRRSSSASATGRTTSSGPPRRRCCSTKSTGSSSGRMRAVRLRPAGDASPRRSPCSTGTGRAPARSPAARTWSSGCATARSGPTVVVDVKRDPGARRRDPRRPAAASSSARAP